MLIFNGSIDPSGWQLLSSHVCIKMSVCHPTLAYVYVHMRLAYICVVLCTFVLLYFPAFSVFSKTTQFFPEHFQVVYNCYYSIYSSPTVCLYSAMPLNAVEARSDFRIVAVIVSWNVIISFHFPQTTCAFNLRGKLHFFCKNEGRKKICYVLYKLLFCVCFVYWSLFVITAAFERSAKLLLIFEIWDSQLLCFSISLIRFLSAFFALF